MGSPKNHLDNIEGKRFLIDPLFAQGVLDEYLAQLLFAEAGFGERRKLTEQISAQREANSFSVSEAPGFPGAKIAVLNLSGAMQLEDGLCSDGMRTMSEQIRQINSNPTYSAILIRANTGGGEALAGQELFNAISDSKKPVVIHADFLASAGVMAGIAADRIIAAGEMSEIGSIGVMSQINMAFLAKYKENYKAIYSAKSPNKNEETRAFMDGNESPLVSRLTELDESFMSLVSQNRELKGDQETIDETLSGRMFTASEAMNRGLIDGIGTYQDALQIAASLGGKRKKTKKSNTMANNFLSAATEKFKTLFASVNGEEKANEAFAADKPELDGSAILSEMTETVNAVKAEMESMKNEMSDLKGQFETLTAENTQLRASLENAQLENANLKADLKVKAEQISQLSGELATLKLSGNDGENNRQSDNDLKQVEKKISKIGAGWIDPA